MKTKAEVKAESDPVTVRTQFRVFRDGEAIAVFPEVPHDVLGNFCVSYQRKGQHGACDPLIASRGDTRPATPAEIDLLTRELESIGYEVIPVSRVSDEMHRARRAAAAIARPR